MGFQQWCNMSEQSNGKSNGKVPITTMMNWVEKLFDTLSKSMDKQSETTQKVYDSLKEWLTIAKNEPRNTDLMNEIKRIEEGGFNLPITTLQAHEKINQSNDLLQKLNKRATALIIAISVAFAVLTGATILGKIVADRELKQAIEKRGADTVIEYRLNEKEIMDKMEKLSKDIDRLEKQIEAHNKDDMEKTQ